jgi:hypothetical protein
MSASLREQLSYLRDQQEGSPTASGSPLARGSSLTAGVISRRPSSALTTPKAADLTASSLNNKQADMYISELLSYSLDRMRKVWPSTGWSVQGLSWMGNSCWCT